MQIRHGGDSHAGRERRGVELVIGVQGEDHVEHARHLPGRLVPFQQGQEVGRVRSARGRRNRLAAGAEPLPGGHGGRHQVHQAECLPQVRVGLVRAHVGVGGRRERHRGPERIERMTFARQATQQVQHRRRERPGLGEPRREGRALRRRGQPPEPQQMRHVLEARRSHQIRDLVAAVVQAARLPVHAADRRARCDHILQPVLVRRRCRRHGVGPPQLIILD